MYTPTPTVLLITRILRRLLQQYDPQKGSSWENENQDGPIFVKIRELVSNYDLLTKSELESYEEVARKSLHCLSQLMMDKEDSNAFSTHKLENCDHTTMLPYCIRLVSKIVMNGFSISDGEQIAIGIGLFHSVAMVNHSCIPNAVQTFHFDVGKEPQLAITVTTNGESDTIKAGDEVTISYIDASAPISSRQKLLQDEYKFHCSCSKCNDLSHDDNIAGLRCPRSSCNGKRYRLANLAGIEQPLEMDVRVAMVGDIVLANLAGIEQPLEMDDDQIMFRRNEGELACTVCNESDFSGVTRKREKAMEVIKKCDSFLKQNPLSNDNHLPTRHENKDQISDLIGAYSALKETCQMQSWYIFYAGEVLIQCLLEYLPKTAADHEQREYCGRILCVIEEIHHAARFCTSWPPIYISAKSSDGDLTKSKHYLDGLSLRSIILHYKAAKLKLFLYADPRDAYDTIKYIRKELMVYYPEHHEIISCLDQCLSGI
eukprot:CAMPEP_0194444264 /NCGR_PEP_ID=MMETSP0176-20130528/127171_1 /TAXON_ID=216777 /ORGANISM="Proboscia alata, Strain PI-D3" /LENGTH=485 /DNA_ID=CAMNT_0039270619 /DNA_START=699 /DNA_END=2155 /DNA_ORIENTATION=+